MKTCKSLLPLFVLATIICLSSFTFLETVQTTIVKDCKCEQGITYKIKDGKFLQEEINNKKCWEDCLKAHLDNKYNFTSIDAYTRTFSLPLNNKEATITFEKKGGSAFKIKLKSKKSRGGITDFLLTKKNIKEAKDCQGGS